MGYRRKGRITHLGTPKLPPNATSSPPKVDSCIILRKGNTKKLSRGYDKPAKANVPHRVPDALIDVHFARLATAGRVLQKVSCYLHLLA
jgi:hypothetical protein